MCASFEIGELKGFSSRRLMLFEEVDKNGNGEIEKSEWEAAFGKGSFDAWDQDWSGTIDKSE